jgi:hypothetical protein
VASARELLEQADALMRRNRSPLMDDIPVLTDSVPVTPAGRPAARLRPASPAAPDTIPMLTEAVPAAPAPVAPATPAPPAAVVEEGEPSDWLQTGGAEPSVIGDAPDSIALAPSYAEAAEVIEVEAPPDVEESFDAELEERARTEAPSHEPDPSQAIGAPELPLPAAEPPAVVEDAQPLPPPELLPPWESDAVDEALAQGGAAPQEAEAAPGQAEAHPEEASTASEEAELPLDMEPLEEAVAFEAFAPEEPFVPASAPEVLVPAAPVLEAGPSEEERKAAEDARWASMAEEIRMQVLQRIDLFTDTGLRDQLGARLQPIVDRASADLVRTINQHVGELLRSYVSEAIEREIENWRRGT